MALVNTGRAVIEEFILDRTIRTVNGLSFPFPKIIRLLNYVSVPFTYAEEFWSKRGVLKRDNNKCCYCGKKATTVDHVFPKSRCEGNPDTWMNTVAACQPCNGRKSNKTPSEAGMFMLYDPSIPMKQYLRSGKKPRKKIKTQ